MALSSESYKWRYDVFLSFKGDDTRKNLTSHLYHALGQKGVNTFKDYKELKRGEHISPALLRAIEDSRISVVILSENYASSTSCLDELVKILKCKNSKGQLVLPVFYNVNPSQVREQQGSYAEALAKHEDKFRDDINNVKRWRAALHEAATLSGWHLGDGQESKFVQRIVEEIWSKLNRTPFNVAKHPVGLDSPIEGILATMKSLRLLMINNAHVTDDIQYLSDELRLIDWPGYLSSTLPPNFHPKRLVSLYMNHNFIKLLWKGAKIFGDLKLVSFSSCEHLSEIPDFSMIPNVESLRLDHCKSLIKVHESVGTLDKLVTLSLLFCSNLKTLPSRFKLKSLHSLLLTGCSKLRRFPEIVENMEHLEEIFLERTAIEELPQSIEYLIGLKCLFLESCQKLEHLPCSLQKLQYLAILNVSGCSKLQELPKLPLNTRYIDTCNCRSLQSFSILSSLSNFVAEDFPMFYQMRLINCHKLINKQVLDHLTNLFYNTGYMGDVRFRRPTAQVVLPGSKIPDWFSYQSTNGLISLEVASRLYGKPVELLFGAVFELDKGAATTGMFSCVFEVTVNDQKRNMILGDFEALDSSHVWLTRINYGRFLWPLNSMRFWNHFRISFAISEVSPKVKVIASLKSCGFHIACNQEGYLIDHTTVRKYTV